MRHGGWSFALIVRMIGIIVMTPLGGERDVDQCQEGEYQGLNSTEEQLQEEEDHREEEGHDHHLDRRGNGVHDAEEYLTREDVAEESGGERDDARQFGDQLDREQERRVRHVLDPTAD